MVFDILCHISFSFISSSFFFFSLLYLSLLTKKETIQSISKLGCTQTLLYFSFCSFRKHSRAREKEIYFLFLPPLPPLRWRSINPPRFLLFITARSTVACEQQTHFRSGREATTGNASAVRRLARRTLTRKKRVCEQAISKLVLYSECYQQTCTSMYRKQ